MTHYKKGASQRHRSLCVVLYSESLTSLVDICPLKKYLLTKTQSVNVQWYFFCGLRLPMSTPCQSEPPLPSSTTPVILGAAGYQPPAPSSDSDVPPAVASTAATSVAQSKASTVGLMTLMTDLPPILPR